MSGLQHQTQTPKIFKIYGPPGTGKTTEILRRIQNDIDKGYAPDSIAFVSFTRSAIEVAKERAREKGLGRTSDFKYWRTLHSLCFMRMGLSKHQIVSQFTNSRFLEIYSIYRNNPSQFIKLSKFSKAFWNNVDKPTFENKVEKHESKLRFEQRFDYTRCLTEVLKYGPIEQVKIAYVDEAQDLSTLQFDVVKSLFSTAEKIVFAGDDDQAIYAWSGSDIETFNTIDGNHTVLSKSHRLPYGIYLAANNLVQNIKSRIPKTYEPRTPADERDPRAALDGSIRYFVDVMQAVHFLNLHKETNKSILILAFTNHWVKYLCARIHGATKCYYRFNGIPSITEKNFIADTWAKSEGRPLKFPLVNFYVNREQYVPNVDFMTVHKAKGLEADYVLLYDRLTPAQIHLGQYDKDELLRMYYVGMTRAREKLAIVTEDLTMSLNIKHYTKWRSPIAYLQEAK